MFSVFLSWTFRTRRVLCTWIKTLLVVAYSLKPLVIYTKVRVVPTWKGLKETREKKSIFFQFHKFDIVLLIVSLVQLWI